MHGMKVDPPETPDGLYRISGLSGEAQEAGVLRADLEKLGRQLDNLLPFPLEGKELVASLEASTEELRARVRIELD
jgi:hypothetical protein